MREAETVKLGEPVRISDVTANVFLKLLEYVYTDAIGEIDAADVAISLLVAAELFMLDRLKALCEVGGLRGDSSATGAGLHPES